MPIYQYHCDECNTFEEVFTQRMRNVKPPKCPKCGDNMEKIIGMTSFVLKGYGWAKDSYGLKEKVSTDD